MQTAWDVMVIGCGAAGASAGWHLARRGKRVLAIDRYSPPHALGSSHGHTRMTRTAYYEHPDYVPLLLRSHALWRELESLTGQSLLHFTGGLYMGPEDSELLTGSLRSARQFGLAADLLSAADLRRRYPQFSPEPGSVGLLEAQAGYLLVERAVGCLVHAALSAGATLLPHTPVLDISDAGTHVVVRTPGARFEAGHVIVTTGAWTSRLLGPAFPAITPTRQTLGWYWPCDPAPFAAGPVWAFDTGGGTLLYGFPMLADRPGLKVAHHAPGPPVDPDRINRNPSDDDRSILSRLASHHIPALRSAPLLDMVTCLYENSPDGHFLLGPHTPTITVAAGLSGHGFKFASVLGEVLADFATDGRSARPVGFLSPGRFASRAQPAAS